mgnify:CR=1 FL=1
MILNRLFEDRAISYQTIFETGDEIQFGTSSGTYIDADTALTIASVFSATSLIADTMSTLPIDTFIRRDGARFPWRPRPAFIDRPDVDIPREAFFSQVITSLLLSGAAYIRVYSRRGEVVNMQCLNPQTVRMERNRVGRVMFHVDGENRPLSSDDILYIPDLMKPGQLKGVSRVEALKDNLGIGKALDQYTAQFFSNGTSLGGVIQYPGQLTQEQAEVLRQNFDAKHGGFKRAHRTGILTGGAEFKPTQTDPEKSMLVESKNQAIADVARAFHMPPHLLGLDKGMSYSSVEENNRFFTQHTLRPIASKIENSLSTLLARYPGGETAFVRFNMEGLLRASLEERTSAYSKLMQMGAMSINEVRSLEDMRPLETPGADNPRVPLANVNIEDSGVKAQMERVKMAQALVYSGFEPSSVLQAFGLPDIDHTGVPSVQLQQSATLDPEDPQSVYDVE